MILREIILVVVGGMALLAAEILKYRGRSIPCDSCEYLVQKGGSPWKYVCNGHVKYYYSCDEFDKPPKYCSKYKRKQQKEPPKVEVVCE